MPCTPTQNAMCVACAKGTYAAGVTASECTPWREMCPPGEEEVHGYAPSHTRNRVCFPCATGTWRVGAKPASAGGLVDLSPHCQPHMVEECNGATPVEASPPTPTSERVCEAMAETTEPAVTAAPDTTQPSTTEGASTADASSAGDSGGFPDGDLLADRSASFGQRQIVLIVLVIVVAVLCIAIVGAIKSRRSEDHEIAPVERALANRNQSPTRAMESQHMRVGMPGSRTHFDFAEPAYEFDETIDSLQARSKQRANEANA